MPTLFDIEGDLARVAEGFDALEGADESPELLEAVEAYFGALLEDRDRKVDGYCRLIADFSAKAKARREESARIARLARADEAAAERLKARLKAFMELHGMTRLEGAYHKVSIAGNGGKAPLVVDVDPEALPDWARKVNYVEDGDAIRARLDAGETLDFARLGERGTGVRIR